MVLIRGSQNDCAILVPKDPDRIGKGDEAFTTPNERRCIEALLRKGMLSGSIEQTHSLALTADAFRALRIDAAEWPERLREGVDHDPAILVVDEGKEDAGPELPAVGPSASATLRSGSKGALVLELLNGPSGTTLDAMQAATGWQAHSVRGFLSGTIRKKLGLALTSEKPDDGDRVYRIVATPVGSDEHAAA